MKQNFESANQLDSMLILQIIVVKKRSQTDLSFRSFFSFSSNFQRNITADRQFEAEDQRNHKKKIATNHGNKQQGGQTSRAGSALSSVFKILWFSFP